jgi:asparagine synthase (glutamine-hydrolysing)
MCGIAGLVGGHVAGLAARMNALQGHRGPDGRGVFEDAPGEVALGHVRLAILDLTSAAAQPMTTADGRFTLVFNGEIYNYRALRDALASQGERFVSTGDTEVLLKGLAREGERFLPKLNGMFSFAFWDARDRELLLARDPIGVKPLYYAEPAPGMVLFASEIKALFAYPGLSRRPNFEALVQHLSFCYATGDETALDGVRRLPPGSLLRWRSRTRKAEISRYWRAPFSRDGSADRSAATEQLKGLLQASAQRQLISDVPVGAFFSGGLDSTLTAALALRAGAKNGFTAYTITYPSSENVLDQAEEDGPYARRAAQTLGIPLHEREIKPDVAGLWPELIYHLDEPIADPAAIACYLLAKLAREEGTPVLLSGQGADELFAGYPRYRAMAASAWADRTPRWIRKGMAGVGRLLPGAREGKLGATSRRVKRVLNAIDEDADRRFLSYCASSSDDSVLSILSPEFLDRLQGRRPGDRCAERMNEQDLKGADRWLDRDLSVYLPNHNLLYTDKMTMAVGLEARVPLLDLDLVDRVVRYPVDWKISGGVTKSILRDAARKVVPDEVIDRPKAGFGAPYRKWLRHDLAPLWEDLTSEAAVRRRGWFDPKGLREARELSQTGKQDLYMIQWAVLTIELWARHFLDNNPADRQAR